MINILSLIYKIPIKIEIDILNKKIDFLKGEIDYLRKVFVWAGLLLFLIVIFN